MVVSFIPFSCSVIKFKSSGEESTSDGDDDDDDDNDDYDSNAPLKTPVVLAIVSNQVLAISNTSCRIIQ